MKDTLSSEHRSDGVLQGILFALACTLCAEFFLHGSFLRGEYLPLSGRILALASGVFIIDRVARFGFDKYRPAPRDLLCLGLTAVGSFVMMFLGQLIAEGLNGHQALRASLPALDASSMLYAIPFASGALLIQAILGLHYGLVFSVLMALTAVVYLPHESLFPVYVLATNLLAVMSLSRTHARSAYLRAGLNIGICALPFVLGSLMIEPNATVATYILRPLLAILGGVVSAIIASGLIPLVEYLGGYVTDLRLIEMATLDHPLLKDLSVRAPGTWNHSMVMGMMGETAADAVGANPVVVRVGAYFHDIGKMTKPLYFVENQFGEENRHDKLSPSMSALIIRAHVKDGLELAREHNLPRVIEDMIPQHHGTSVIEFFYEKALAEAEESGQEVDKNLYTYPGPKPQTKEAGILMLADGIEAAARTLSEPSLDRIQGLVQKMINKVFSSGELDECELTLKDLHEIAKCFTRVLHGIHHQRIAYAEPAEKVNEKSDDAELVAAESGDEGAAEEKKEDLKRLGL